MGRLLARVKSVSAAKKKKKKKIENTEQIEKTGWEAALVRIAQNHFPTQNLIESEKWIKLS